MLSFTPFRDPSHVAFTGVEYEIKDIDLKGFKVQSENVEVTLLDNGIKITATGIKCVLTGEKFIFSQSWSL